MSGIVANSYRAGRLGRPVAAVRQPVPAWAATLLAGAIIGLSLALLSPIPASAQLTETESIVNRLIRLEREIQTLNLQVYRGAPAPTAESGAHVAMPEGYAAQFEVRLTQIERQLRESTGLLEQSQFHVRQLTDRLNRALTDIEFRLTLLEGGEPPEPGAIPFASTDSGALSAPVPLESTQAPAQPLAAPAAAAGLTTAPDAGTLGALDMSAQSATSVAPVAEAAPAAPAVRGAAVAATATTVALPVGSADSQYDFAYGLLAQGDYGRAEQALSMFAEAHPENPLTSNAQYWLGETFYVRGQYDDAAIAFAQGYQSFPEGAKAVDSLLKLGMALAAGGNRSDACLTLNQLDTEFPDAPTGIKRRATQERSRLQCI